MGGRPSVDDAAAPAPTSCASTPCSPTASGARSSLTEDFDVTERQPRGNLPQAFVHALLLECAATLPPLEAPGART
ncbi:hypothetical protein Acsp07_37050 [Actinomycetospora sp. NBRC 106378]|nr:hypothetical protein Acsp07_37050 [Actinomycetospora sp. NBRC 106378]